MDTDPSASADRYTYNAPWPVYGVSLARRRVCGFLLFVRLGRIVFAWKGFSIVFFVDDRLLASWPSYSTVFRHVSAWSTR